MVRLELQLKSTRLFGSRIGEWFCTWQKKYEFVAIPNITYGERDGDYLVGKYVNEYVSIFNLHKLVTTIDIDICTNYNLNKLQQMSWGSNKGQNLERVI